MIIQSRITCVAAWKEQKAFYGSNLRCSEAGGNLVLESLSKPGKVNKVVACYRGRLAAGGAGERPPRAPPDADVGCTGLDSRVARPMRPPMLAKLASTDGPR